MILFIYEIVAIVEIVEIVEIVNIVVMKFLPIKTFASIFL